MSRKKNSAQSHAFVTDKTILRYANESINAMISDLNVPTLGLTEEYVVEELNKKQSVPKFAWFKTILGCFNDLFTMLLVVIVIYSVCMFIYYLVSDKETDYTYLVGALIVIISITASIVVTLVTQYGIWKGNQKLYYNHVERVKVLRNVILDGNHSPFTNKEKESDLLSKLQDINIDKMLIGDLIYLKTGDVVPADSRILFTSGISVNQEIFTGNSQPIRKNYFNNSLSRSVFEQTNIIFRGSKIIDGDCWAITIDNPNDSVYAKVVAETSKSEQKTSFDEQVKKVINVLIWTVAIFVPTIFVLVLVLNGSSHEHGFSEAKTYVDAILFAMAIAIALSPDALPMMLSAAFYHTRKHLIKKNISIRSLSSIQNIGSMDVLAIDVSKIFLNKDYFLKDYVDLNNKKSDFTYDLMVLSFANAPSSDAALNRMVLSLPDYQQRLEKLQQRYVYQDLNNFALGTYLVFFDKQLNKLIYIKRDKIDNAIALASYSADQKTKQLVPILDNQKVQHLYQPSSGPLLSIGIDYKYFEVNEVNDLSNQELYIYDYIYAGKVDFSTTLKSGSASIIKEIEKQEVEVVIFSKKSLAEVISLSRDLNFKVKDSINGRSIIRLTDEQLIEKIRDANVFYNLSLQDELRLLRVIKKMNHTVGYFGADIEDSYQLLVADVGITTDDSDDFGKNCASLVVSHLDLMQILTSLRESRIGLVNMMKYIKLKTTGTLSLTMKMVIGMIMFNHETMIAVQLLSQNLIYNMVEYTIIYDNLNEQQILRPIKYNSRSVIPFVAANGAVIVTLNVIVLLIVAFAFDSSMFMNIRTERAGTNWETQLKIIQTACFIEDSLSHILFIWVARDNYERFWKQRPSKPLLFGLILGAIVFILLATVPPIQRGFGMASPHWEFIFIIIVDMLVMMVCVDQIKEFYFRKQILWF